MTESSIVRRLRAIAGSDIQFDITESGVPCVAPSSDATTALILEAASREGWTVRIIGESRWSAPDTQATMLLTASQMQDITYLNAGDLVATAQAGTPWSVLRNRLADVGAWLPIDPPGDERSVGSVVATGTAGPLRCGYGSIGDHVIGTTMVTGDGKVVKPGGKVVKNVAGFDLAKLAIGSFGAFGLITHVTFRLRAIPRSDVTLVTAGQRDRLLATALQLLEHDITPAAMELFSSDPDDDWMLAIRLIGTDEAVATVRDAVAGATDVSFQVEANPRELWQDHASGCLEHPVTLRAGVPPQGLAKALDLVRHDLAGGWTSVSVFPGAIRWSGDVKAEGIKIFRHHGAQHEFPVTVERAPLAYLRDVGHFGAYREGVGRLVERLRSTFDPSGVFAAPVNAT